MLRRRQGKTGRKRGWKHRERAPMRMAARPVGRQAAYTSAKNPIPPRGGIGPRSDGRIATSSTSYTSYTFLGGYEIRRRSRASKRRSFRMCSRRYPRYRRYRKRKRDRYFSALYLRFEV